VHVVLNWIWQGGAVALAAAALLRVIPTALTQARYWAVWAACVLVLALPVIPVLFAVELPAATIATGADAVVPLSMPVTWWTSARFAMVMFAIWCAFQAGRLTLSVVALRNARTQCREFPPVLEARLRHWSQVKETGRRARLVLSDRIRSAAVLGCGRPVIAVAPSLLDHLSDADLDRVVIHEWAHIQRHDDVVHAMQLIIHLIAGWHPALWWLERQLRLEREVASDELAVAVTGSAKRYAACLATLATIPVLPVRALPSVAVGSSGLRRRVIRILAAPHVVPGRPWRAIALSASAGLAMLAFTLGGTRLVESGGSSSSFLDVGQLIKAPSVAIAHESPAIPLAEPIVSSVQNVARRAQSSSRGITQSESESRSAHDIAREDNAMPTPPASPVTTIPARSLALSHGSLTPGATLTEVNAVAPWAAAAATGQAVGRRYQSAAIATGDHFKQLGRKLASSF
jgi:beta-lactamase regulating signal transducer with metallopeptidase domain